jgi:hypothetical protein
MHFKRTTMRYSFVCKNTSVDTILMFGCLSYGTQCACNITIIGRFPSKMLMQPLNALHRYCGQPFCCISAFIQAISPTHSRNYASEINTMQCTILYNFFSFYVYKQLGSDHAWPKLGLLLSQHGAFLVILRRRTSNISCNTFKVYCCFNGAWSFSLSICNLKNKWLVIKY